ncbi:CDP-glycerol glycerophosphotransferase family protein [Amphibacillus cookii]|uniref:CDP-glycerol glycerophosphotransferase family protein n=1 Tax=Amphibacillus cookii TaxID=767787 RepID=UPI00195A7433|nr:CDP-glycerol glycerophosphotransferase family protein [Amphibacillus cookii]MBM7539791.1 CDP-glycerol glycerophosphotransferase [Amphibacillus cookii]
MNSQKWNHAEIFEISQKNNGYRIKVPIKEKAIDAHHYFILICRNDGSETVILPNVIGEENSFKLFEFILDPDQIEDSAKHIFNNHIFDLFFVIEEDQENIKRKRIKSDFKHYRYLALSLEKEKKLFYPYTTGKGNLSFRYNDYKLFAEIDKLMLDNNGKVSLSGLINFPPLYQEDEYTFGGMRLVVKNNLNEDEINVPLDPEKRRDIHLNVNDHLKINNTINGFRGEFDPVKYFNKDLLKNIYFSFYIDLEYKVNGDQEVIRSIRVKCSHQTNIPKRLISKLDNDKVKFLLRKTKRAHYLSLSITRYSLIRELKRNIQREWTRVRRSKSLLRLYKSVFNFIGMLPNTKNKVIVFESFMGKQYSDNPRAIYEYMLEHHPEYKMYWSADRRNVYKFKGKNLNYIRRFSVKWLIQMTRARYWVVNARMPLWIKKPKRTIYLQTWHGTPLKRLGIDIDEVQMPGTNSERYRANFMRAVSKWDYLISPNPYSTEIFRRAFQFDKTMIESGYPRNDILVNHNNTSMINKLKDKNNLPKDKKIILYAPTWRDNQFYAKGKYKFNLEFDLDQMQESLSDQYIILLRMHYLIAENLDISSYEGFVYDFSHYEDIRELYLLSDILITDYSSVFFDYANLKRPMLFFVYDIEDYRDNLRGFYFDFEKKAPGPLVKKTEEIIDYIKRIDKEGYQFGKKEEEFYNKFCSLENGTSSETVVKEVFDLDR